MVQPTGTNLHAVLDATSTTAVTQATAANLNATVVQSSGSNLHVNVDSAPTTTVTGTVAATQSGTWNINNITGSVSLPTGAAQEHATAGSPGSVRLSDGTSFYVGFKAGDSIGNTAFTANAGTNLNTSALALSATQTNGTQQTKITDGTNVSAVKAASTAPVAADPALVVALSPNGSQATAVAQGSTTSGQSGTLAMGAVTTDDPAYVTAQSSPLSLNTRGGIRFVPTGMDMTVLVRNDYSTTNVTTAAYVQLVASTTAAIHRMHIFDSSGQDFVLATGGAGSEVDQIQISPGGWDSPVELYIPSGTRISIKSKSATASSGILLITGLK